MSILTAALFSGGCAAIFGGDEHALFRVRAVPGPDAYETLHVFQRRDLMMKASATEEKSKITFHLEFKNIGTAKIQIRAEHFRLRARGAAETETVEMLEHDDPRPEFWLLPHETRMLDIRQSGDSVMIAAPAALEVRGIRDEYGEGDYQFDLSIETSPKEEDPGARGIKRPEVLDESRRPLRESTQDETGIIKKKK